MSEGVLIDAQGTDCCCGPCGVCFASVFLVTASWNFTLHNDDVLPHDFDCAGSISLDLPFQGEDFNGICQFWGENSTAQLCHPSCDNPRFSIAIAGPTNASFVMRMHGGPATTNYKMGVGWRIWPIDMDPETECPIARTYDNPEIFELYTCNLGQQTSISTQVILHDPTIMSITGMA